MVREYLVVAATSFGTCAVLAWPVPSDPLQLSPLPELSAQGRTASTALQPYRFYVERMGWVGWLPLILVAVGQALSVRIRHTPI